MGYTEKTLRFTNRIRALRDRVGSTREAGKLLGVSQVVICNVINGWYPYLESLENKVGAKLAELERNPPPRNTPKVLTLRQRMWNSMRVMRVFSLQDLVATAESDYQGVRIYVMHLVKAGILRVAQRHSNKPGCGARYQIVIDCGPHAPRVRKGHRVFDPNHNREYHYARPEEESAHA